MTTFRLIGCDVLREESEQIISSISVSIDATWLEMGLHDEPEKLNVEIRRLLEECRGREYDAVLLLFGLCSNAAIGLSAPDTPLVIPRVHDCITLYLGSRESYDNEHEKEPGTYWFTRGFLHREDGGTMGHAVGEQGNREKVYQQYVEEYGEENAEYLMEVWVDSWKSNYTRAVLLTDDNRELPDDRKRVQNLATENNWRYEEIPANLVLLEKLFAGNWPEDEFLVVSPGEAIIATHDCLVLGSLPESESGTANH